MLIFCVYKWAHVIYLTSFFFFFLFNPFLTCIKYTQWTNLQPSQRLHSVDYISIRLGAYSGVRNWLIYMLIYHCCIHKDAYLLVINYTLRKILGLTKIKVTALTMWVASMPLIVLSVAREPTLMENAPDWKESVATESEADVSAVSFCLYPCVTCSQYLSFIFVCTTDQSRERAWCFSRNFEGRNCWMGQNSQGQRRQHSNTVKPRLYEISNQIKIIFFTLITAPFCFIWPAICTFV